MSRSKRFGNARMSPDEKVWGVAVGELLRYGVLLCTVLLLLGYMLQPWFLDVSKLLLWSGIALLITLPMIRVAFMVVLFAYKRDFRYVVVALLVLAILVCGPVLMIHRLGGRFFGQ